MGGPRTGAKTQSTAGAAASSAGAAERERRSGGRRRWAAITTCLLAGLVLFVVYLRLSETYQLNSDSANILLMGSDLLHGHLLLHGWYMSDVSFYLTELPQYALLEGILGLHMQTAHVAAAMTYTLTFLLALLLARSGSFRRGALAREDEPENPPRLLRAPLSGAGPWPGGGRRAGGGGGGRGSPPPPRDRGVPGGRPPGLALP